MAGTSKHLDLTITGDLLSGKGIGRFSNPSSIDPKTWERSPAGNTYYGPIGERTNIHLLTETIVEKIIFQELAEGLNDTLVTATGVQFVHSGKHYTVNASKEIIFSAGALQSPQLLGLSGIRSSERLKALEIIVVIENSGVGENLQIHDMAGVCLEVADGVPAVNIMREPHVAQAAMEAYQTSRYGLLKASFISFTFLPVLEFFKPEDRKVLAQLLAGHLSDSNQAFASEVNQYMFLRSIFQSLNEAFIALGMGPVQVYIETSRHKDIPTITAPENYMRRLVSLPHPFLRGSVRINSTSPKDKPTANPNYLSHPLDVEILARYLQNLPKTMITELLASFIKKRWSLSSHQCRELCKKAANLNQTFLLRTYLATDWFKFFDLSAALKI